FFEFVTAAQLALAHIGAAAERSVAAVQDRDLGLGIEVEAAERLGELLHHLVADRVELIRAVQRNRRDPLGAGVLDKILIVAIHHSLPRAVPVDTLWAACGGGGRLLTPTRRTLVAYEFPIRQAARP